MSIRVTRKSLIINFSMAALGVQVKTGVIFLIQNVVEGIHVADWVNLMRRMLVKCLCQYYFWVVRFQLVWKKDLQTLMNANTTSEYAHFEEMMMG